MFREYILIEQTSEIMKKVDKNDEFLKIGELAKQSGYRISTLKYFSEIGILPFHQEDERLVRRYKREEALKRLKEIAELKEVERRTIEEIKKYFG